jgi:hypothetical protein
MHSNCFAVTIANILWLQHGIYVLKNFLDYICAYGYCLEQVEIFKHKGCVTMLPLLSISNSISEIAFNSKSPMIGYNCDSFF